MQLLIKIAKYWLLWFYLTLFFVFLLSACSTTVEPIDTKVRIGGAYVEIVNIDTCEYLILGGTSISHKGNCKNCLKRK